MRLYPSIKDKIVNPFSIDVPDDLGIDDLINAELFTGNFVTPVTPVNLNTHEDDALGIIGVDAEVTIFLLVFFCFAFLHPLV